MNEIYVKGMLLTCNGQNSKVWSSAKKISVLHSKCTKPSE